MKTRSKTTPLPDDEDQWMTEGEPLFDKTAVERLSKDLADAAMKLSDRQARFLVDNYYTIQENRIRAGNQVFALGKAQEPNLVLKWFQQNSQILENQLKRALDRYTEAHLMGPWQRSIVGIGPVLSAGLLANIDIDQCPTAGHIYRFAGLDPDVIWPSTEDAKAWLAEHGLDIDAAANHFGRRANTLTKFATRDRDGNEINLTKDTLARAISRRPWNARLKVISWKIGESFKKNSGRPNCFYGRLYQERKRYEVARNESGGNAATAAKALTEKNWSKGTVTYQRLIEGKLSDMQLDLRAMRWATKIYLGHLQQEWWRRKFNEEPPKPFPIAILGHAHEIKPPV